MPALIPFPGTPDRPAQLDEQVALFSDPPFSASFGTLPGTVELDNGGQTLTLPVTDVLWTDLVIVAKLPAAAAVPDPDGPSTIRATPDGLLGQPFETPLVIGQLNAVAAALEELTKGFELVVEAGGGELLSRPVALQPGDQPLRLRLRPATGAGFALRSNQPPGSTPSPAPAPRPGGRRQTGPGRRLAPGAVPRTTFPEASTVTLDLAGLPTDLAGPLAGAQVTASARLEVTGQFADEELVATPRLDTLGFTLLAAPAFVEQVGRSPALNDPAARTLTVQARVTLTADFPSPAQDVPGAERVIPPIDPPAIQVMPVEVPTMLALFRHRNFQQVNPAAEEPRGRDGFVLVVVLEQSNVNELVDDLGQVINPGFFNVADFAAGPASVLRAIPALGPAIDALQLFVRAVRAQPGFAVQKGDLTHLNRIKMLEQGRLRRDTDAEDQISSLLLFGRPGAVAALYCDREFESRRGQLNVGLGSTALPPLRLVALPSLPASPVAALTELDVTNLVVSAVNANPLVNPVAPAKREDRATNTKVFADKIRSVKLEVPPAA